MTTVHYNSNGGQTLRIRVSNSIIAEISMSSKAKKLTALASARMEVPALTESASAVAGIMVHTVKMSREIISALP